MSKYGKRTLNWFEAVINKMGGDGEADRFLREELVLVERPVPPAPVVTRRANVTKLSALAGPDGMVSTEDIEKCLEPKWTVDDEGNIHLTVVSNGMTREQWKSHLERRGWRLSDLGRNVLCRASGAPTNGVSYHIVVRPGKLIKDNDRCTKKIRVMAEKRGWQKPHWEVACLIRDNFTDEELEQMGLWYIVTMHEPIIDSDGGPSLLDAHRIGEGRYLDAFYDSPDRRWGDVGGFAFSVPQVVPQT